MEKEELSKLPVADSEPFSGFNAVASQGKKETSRPNESPKAARSTVSSQRPETEASAEGETTATGLWRFLFDDVLRDDGSRQCRMIHPRSFFSQFLLAFSTVALVYTAAVVPVVISFEWNQNDECEWGKLLNIDLTFDTFFICEVILTFFVADINAKGHVVDNWREVGKRYIKGSVAFDVITAIPISYAELYVYQICQSQTDAPLDPSKWRFARLVKPLKFVRIMRIYRAFASVDITYHLEKLFRIPPMAFSLFRVILGIFAMTHISACSFWMVKVLTNSNDDMEGFLVDNSLPPDASTSQQYVLCCYFIITIFTTVGFGDISATNTYEQVACMVLMLTGAIVFGTLLSEVQSGVAELRKLVREKGQIVQDLKNFLLLQQVPRDTQRRILDWAGFEVSVMQEQRGCSEAMQRLTHGQRLEVCLHMHDTASPDINLFNLSHAAKDEMLAHLWASAETVVFEQGKVVFGPGDRIDAMLVIAAGVVRVEDVSGNMVVELRQGETVGMWALMGDSDASSHFGYPVVFVADAHLKAHKISRDLFQEVIARCPEGLVAEIRELWEQHLRSKERLELLASDTVEFRRVITRWGAIVDKLCKRRLRKLSASANSSKKLQRRLLQQRGNDEAIGEEDPNTQVAPAPSMLKALKRAVASGETRLPGAGTFSEMEGGGHAQVDGGEGSGAQLGHGEDVGVVEDEGVFEEEGVGGGGEAEHMDRVSDEREAVVESTLPLHINPEMPPGGSHAVSLASLVQKTAEPAGDERQVSWEPAETAQPVASRIGSSRRGAENSNTVSSVADAGQGRLGGEWVGEKAWLVKNMTRLESRVTTMDSSVEQIQDELGRLTAVCNTILKAVGADMPSVVGSERPAVLRGAKLQSQPLRMPQIGSLHSVSASARSSKGSRSSLGLFKSVARKAGRQGANDTQHRPHSRAAQLLQQSQRLRAESGSVGNSAASGTAGSKSVPSDITQAATSLRGTGGSGQAMIGSEGSSRFSRRNAGGGRV